MSATHLEILSKLHADVPGDNLSAQGLLSDRRVIFGSGEMADRTRNFAWEKTSVGPIQDWPLALLVIVNTILESPHPMFLWWGADLVQFYNDAYRQSLRDDKHPQALGQKGAECWPEIWSIIFPQIDQVMTGGATTWKQDELFTILRDGRSEEVHWTYGCSPVRGAQGKISGTLVTCMENTRQKQAETAMRDELRMLSEMFEQAPAFFCILRGPDYIFERVNPLYRQMLGERPLEGRTVRDAVPEVASQGFMELLDGVYTSGKPWIGHNTPMKLKSPDSDRLEERIVDFVYQPMRDADGAVSGILVFGVDVTEAKRHERALLHSERLVAVGRLATTIAHEINNPLETVANLLHLIQEETESPEVLEHAFLAQQEVRRIANISVNTLKFSRQTTGATRTELHDVLDSVQAMYLGRVRHSGICILARYREHAPYTSYAAELRQVFANFFSNALDATPIGGRIHLRTRQGSWPGTGDTRAIPGILVTIADTGCGMSSDHLGRIYEAFFTTKEVTGTGLGLWLSRDLVRKHHGRIQVRSRQGAATNSPLSEHAPPAHHAPSGTVFRIFLPFQNGLQPA